MARGLQVPLVRNIYVVVGLLPSPIAPNQPGYIGGALVPLAESFPCSCLATLHWRRCPKKLSSWADVLVTHCTSPQQCGTFCARPGCFSSSVCPASILSAEQSPRARATRCRQILLACPWWSRGRTLELELLGAHPWCPMLHCAPLVPGGKVTVGEGAMKCSSLSWGRWR